MTKKFTEEQYETIIYTWNSSLDYDKATELVVTYVNGLNLTMYEKALALANPLTREWAHDKFVEKENKYRWSSKKTDEKGNHILLYKETDGRINIVFTDYNGDLEYNQQLTESEIREWGFNPEMFDREEV